MTNSTHHRLGDLQLRILQELWRAGEASVGEVHERLGAKKALAYTTIATMLRKMEGRGLVAHREEGRSYLYRALVTSDEVSRSMGVHFVERIFSGNLASAVSHLLQTREVSPAELDELAKLIKQAKQKLK
jgi:predicted transcriptional regulator